MIKREKISRGGIRMSKLSRIVLFAVTFLTFIISVKLFWNMGVYVDEAGTSPDKVCGGDFWLYMDWLRLLLLLGHMAGLRNHKERALLFKVCVRMQVQPIRSIPRSSGFLPLLESSLSKEPSVCWIGE